MDILVPFYPIIYFYIFVHIALFIVTYHLGKHLKKYPYLQYLSKYFLWCIGYGVGYLFYFHEKSELVSLSYFLFFISFLMATSQLIAIAYSILGYEQKKILKISYYLILSFLFIFLIIINKAILLNIIVSTIGLIPTIKLWQKEGGYKFVGPLIFLTIISSLIYAIYKTPESLQIQFYFTILTRISLTILLTNIAQTNAEIEHKHLENQLHHTEKMEALGQLASGVAHDFNNMLSGITGSADILKDSSNSDFEKKYLNIILNASERAANLTQKLLIFSRKEEKISSEIDVLSIIQDVRAILERTINKTIAIDIKNNAMQTTIIGDDTMIENAFLNMAINANHAMPNGGTLTFILNNKFLIAEYCKESPFEITQGHYLEVIIQDTGIGMSPEIQTKIFDPFFTTKEEGKGTGLGLSSVYGMVQKHSGAITVYSEEGSGTAFHIFFPLSTQRIKNTIENSTAIIHGEGCILLIDDEELIRKTAKTQLEKLGYTAILATNGIEGLKVYKEQKESIDIIILDMIMPKLNGKETLKQLRKINKTIPILISSGFSNEEDIIELQKFNITGFLHKPFRYWELSQKLSDIIFKKQI